VQDLLAGLGDPPDLAAGGEQQHQGDGGELVLTGPLEPSPALTPFSPGPAAARGGAGPGVRRLVGRSSVVV
jgi:hypothetical protein